MTFRTTAGTIASVMHHLGKGASVAHVAVAVPTCAMMAQAGVHVGPQCPATSAPCPLADREPQVAVGRPCAAQPMPGPMGGPGGFSGRGGELPGHSACAMRKIHMMAWATCFRPEEDTHPLQGTGDATCAYFAQGRAANTRLCIQPNSQLCKCRARRWWERIRACTWL